VENFGPHSAQPDCAGVGRSPAERPGFASTSTFACWKLLFWAG
jgi:hypothetical protein